MLVDDRGLVLQVISCKVHPGFALGAKEGMLALVI